MNENAADEGKKTPRKIGGVNVKQGPPTAYGRGFRPTPCQLRRSDKRMVLRNGDGAREKRFYMGVSRAKDLTTRITANVSCHRYYIVYVSCWAMDRLRARRPRLNGQDQLGKEKTRRQGKFPIQ